MSRYNKVILVGRVGRDPEARSTNNGTAVANFSLATDRYTKRGEDPITDWHRITAWGTQAEYVTKYCTKGSLILIEGEIQYSKYTDKDGIERNSTDIQARNVQGLGSKSQQSNDNDQSDNYRSERNNRPNHTHDEPPF